MNALLSESRQDDGSDRTGVLSTLTLRRRLTNEQAAARSQMVRRLRIALPVLALALVAALLVNTRSTDQENHYLDDFANIEATPEELRMASPRFAGVDDKGRPYEITAEAALQSPGSQEIVELVRPRAVTRAGADSTVVYADKGVYESRPNVLSLADGVTLEHKVGDGAYTLRTARAVVAIGEETVHAPGTVEGEGPAGALRADSMRAFNGEGRVLFEGNVSMRIYPSKTNIKQPAADEAVEP